MIALKFVTSASAGCRRHPGIFLKRARAAKAAACPAGVVAAAVVRFQPARHNVAAPQCGRHTASHVACPQDRQIGSVGSIPEQSKKLYAQMIALKFVTSASAGCRRHPGIFLKPALAAKAAACPARPACPAEAVACPIRAAAKAAAGEGGKAAGSRLNRRAAMWQRHYLGRKVQAILHVHRTGRMAADGPAGAVSSALSPARRAAPVCGRVTT